MRPSRHNCRKGDGPLRAGQAGSQLLQRFPCLAIARGIANRLRCRYPWVPADDLYSYALFGLVRAAVNYDPDRSVPFAAYAGKKALFAAIDEMRKDRILFRAGHSRRPITVSLDKLLVADQKHWWRLCDQTARKARQLLEARQWCATMLAQLDEADRRLIVLRYDGDMTFHQIGQVMGISESTVWLRHHRLITRFRGLAKKFRSETLPEMLGMGETP